MDSQTLTELSPQHGLKRPADDELENDQRLTKRFNLLNLENIGKLYIPVQQPSPPPRRSRSNAFSNPIESMNVDETSDKVYIANLDDEISDTESESERLVFLSDIEKRLTKIPKSVLTGKTDDSHKGNELVLYGVPEAISIPREQDNVRKAILESRERARQAVIVETPKLSISHEPGIALPGLIGGMTNGHTPEMIQEPVIDIYDEDAMDIG